MEARCLKALPRFTRHAIVPCNGISPFTGYIVFRAYDALLERRVIVKSGSTPKNMHMDLIQEYDVLCSLQHEGVIKVLDFDTVIDGDCSISYLVMEDHKIGGRRSRWREVFRHMDEQQVEEFVSNLLSTLCYLVGRRILHEDVEMANIVASKVTHPVLIDFGRVQEMDYLKRSLYEWLHPKNNTRVNAWVRELCGIGGVYEKEGAMHPAARMIIERQLA